MLTNGASTYTKSGLDEMLVSPQSDLQEHQEHATRVLEKGHPV